MAVIDDIVITDIKDSYSKGILIPFIGAGFSQNIEKYPSWNGFIRILEKDIGIKLLKIFNNNYLEATEYYILVAGDRKSVV